MSANASDIDTGGSLRRHPQLAALFKAAESRHLTEQELAEYCAIVPEYTVRATAAREVAAIEQSVVQEVIDEIFAVYPYEKHHAAAAAKCPRDVRYVSAYATLSMLMNDPAWFDDKLLLWLKTILQAFEFPDRTSEKRKVLFGSSGDDKRLDNLKPMQRSIHETYSKLRQRYQERLSPDAYRLLESYLQQAIDVLSAD